MIYSCCKYKKNTQETKWVQGYIKKINIWNNELFSLVFFAKINPFIAGQFGKIKINFKNKIFIRYYSYVNNPKNKFLEFYLKRVKTGIISNLLYKYKKNDKINVSKISYGNLTINNIIKCKTLWMFSTGTGISPFISILSSKILFNNIENFKLVYSIKFFNEYNYYNKLKNIKYKLKNNLDIIILTTREKNKNSLNMKILDLISNIYIKNKMNIKFDIKNDYFMICGNPNFVNNLKYHLIYNEKINYKNILFEKY